VRFGLVLAGLLLAAAPIGAQRNGVQLDVNASSANALTEGPVVTTSGLLADQSSREILQAGFVTQVTYRLELWRKGGLFYDIDARSEWMVRIQFDPHDELYHVVRIQGNQLEDFGGFATVTTAEAQFGRAYRARIHPNRSGRFYYNLVVEVQPLLESDLDAVQQWLKGSSSPAKSTAVESIRDGLGRLMSRVIGGDKKRYEARSGVFTVP